MVKKAVFRTGSQSWIIFYKRKKVNEKTKTELKEKMSNTQNTIFSIICDKKNDLNKDNNTRAWNKFIGNYFMRVIKIFLFDEISDNYQVTEPNAYIKGFPIEYDLLIVRKDSNPEKYTHSFDPKDVYYGLELKLSGIYARKENLRDKINNIKSNFDLIKNRHSHIDFSYLVFSEVTNPKMKGSIDYLKENRAVFEPEYGVFCLSDDRQGKITSELANQWDKFVQRINQHLP